MQVDAREERLAGRVAVVTGGSRGIGLGIARKLLADGASVAIGARGLEGLDAAKDELSAAFGESRVLAVSAHCAREEDVSRLFELVVERFGRVDIAINNAATNPSMASLVDIELDVFDKILSTNLRGYLLVTRAAVARFRERESGGAIVNVSTVGAFRAMPGLGAYGVSKAAVNALTRSLAAELSAEGIRVNGVAPGLVRTRFSEALWKDPAAEQRMIHSIPLRRIAEPDDIAGAVAFLAGDEARYITGETLVVDGGLLAV